MIKYDLKCKNGHEFEGWFSNSSDYDAQRKKRLVDCPYCETSNVEKAIMAPAVTTGRKSSQALAAVADRIRQEISENCEDVGDKFADEARAIHYGEKPERGIYGKASAKEAQGLLEEGVSIAPLPEALLPAAKKTLN